MNTHEAPLPVTIIGGYLGSGKTTLVNHLLRHAEGLRIAVLVNDFGDLPIDTDLIEAEHDQVIALTGGCLCCSFGNDLAGTLNELREMPIDHVLIEASGVALPGALAGSIRLLQGFTLDGVVVLADAETLLERERDRYMGDTIRHQIDAADVIVLNRIDLAPEQRTAQTQAWLADRVPGVALVRASRASVALPVVLGARLDELKGDSPVWGHQASEMFVTCSYRFEAPIDTCQLAQDLTTPELGLLRAKGFALDRDGIPRAIQVVGQRWAVSAVSRTVDYGVVCIGLSTRLRRDALDRLAAKARGQSES